MPLLSIITINYNDKSGLEKTFKSVFDQSYQDFQFILIDGGSSDGSKTLIENHRSKIDYWVSEPDRGIYNAMNKGIMNATGEYLLFVNSGDYLYSNSTLSLAIRYFESKAKDIYYGNIIMKGDHERLMKYPEKLTFNFFFGGSLGFPCTFIKKESLLQLNCFDENYKIASDWKFFIVGICKYKFTYQYIDETITVFNLDGISSTNTKLAFEEREIVLKQEFELFIDDYNEYILLKNYFKKYNLYKIRNIFVFFKNKYKMLKMNYF